MYMCVCVSFLNQMQKYLLAIQQLLWSMKIRRKWIKLDQNEEQLKEMEQSNEKNAARAEEVTGDIFQVEIQ